MKPEARLDKLLIQEVGDELVLFDQRRNKAHHLNRTAALVWQSCDGERTAAELAQLLKPELGGAADEALVWQALERLGKAHLLREPVTRPTDAEWISRRQAFRKLARTAALVLLVPAVTSVVVPAAWAQPGSSFFDCGSRYCRAACSVQCRRDSDCPSSTPVCRVVECRNPYCPCTQRRCVKAGTASRF